MISCKDVREPASGL